MKNVYDIRQEKRGYYVLTQKSIEKTECKINLERVAILVNLFYEDTIEYYLKYLKGLDKRIDIYIATSNEVVYRYFSQNEEAVDNIRIIKKENRGRDISALLVASKEKLTQYEYICFVHDKKYKTSHGKKDVELWIKNLWDNMLASDNYVKNILNLFFENSELGLLVPPEPLGDYFSIGNGVAWYKNFENTMLLKEKLSLECDISIEKSPITLGSVFWCRREALRKLFEYDWKYTDFDDEPLPDDGTLSHAIERILGYVAQDAGYDTYTVMTSAYARIELSLLHKNLENSFSVLKEVLGVRTPSELFSYNSKKKQISDFFKSNKDVYLYGAGERGLDCLKFVKSCGYMPKGFVVTKKDSKDIVEGIEVVEFSAIEKNDLCGIIVTPAYFNQQEVLHMLDREGFSNYITFLDY